MSNSKGKETYVVIFRRSLAECSNRWGWSEWEHMRGEGRKTEKGEKMRGRKGEETYLQITGIVIATQIIQHG